jgi:hypothetical protein
MLAQPRLAVATPPPAADAPRRLRPRGAAAQRNGAPENPGAPKFQGLRSGDYRYRPLIVLQLVSSTEIGLQVRPAPHRS